MIGIRRPFARAPRRTLKSIGFSAQACTSMRRSLSPGTGTGMSCSFKTSGPPNSGTTSARIAESDGRTISSNHFMQTASDLAKGAMLDGIDQLLKNVLSSLHDAGEAVERWAGMFPMRALEFRQTVQLQFSLLRRRSHDFHFRFGSSGFAIGVRAPDGPRAIVDLLFVAVGGGLNLAAVVAHFGGGENTAKPNPL